MHKIQITADQLVSALLALASTEPVCILDSCGVNHLGSHLLIAGIEPVETLEIIDKTASETLLLLDEKLSGELACVFTLSYDFGLRLLDIPTKQPPSEDALAPKEPDLFLACFDVLIVHDYDSGNTFLTGNAAKFETVSAKLKANVSDLKFQISNRPPQLSSNFTRSEYLAAIGNIKERIRQGDTYQTNLTQQLTVKLPDETTPENIFARLRRDNPAPFSAFIKRIDSTVISASPERFFRVGSPTVREGFCDGDKKALPYGRATDTKLFSDLISTSPIKGTRPRGLTNEEDARLKNELLMSKKDIAENTMIVDLLRNDLGRVCEFGTVCVEKLCDLEEHPTLFHLVSTISGKLREDAKFSDILKALFPCGSITGAPKISTMKIIDEIEPTNRGLSMGAIGYFVQSPKSKVQGHDQSLDYGHWTLDGRFDLSVAIRTMVIRDQTVTFNVGGGIVIDSDPESEYQETLTKAKAILAAIGAGLESLL